MKNLLILFACIIVLGAEVSAQWNVRYEQLTSLPTNANQTIGRRVWITQPINYGNVSYAANSLWTSDGVSWIFINYISPSYIFNTDDPSNIVTDATHRFVTDAQITAWNTGGGVVTSLFELDANGDLQPIVGTSTDNFFDLNANGDIEPK
jgi:hypothetical protein